MHKPYLDDFISHTMQHYGHTHYTALLREYDIADSVFLVQIQFPPDDLQFTEATEMKVMCTRSYCIKEILCLYLMRHEVLLRCSDWFQISELKRPSGLSLLSSQATCTHHCTGSEISVCRGVFFLY